MAVVDIRGKGGKIPEPEGEGAKVPPGTDSSDDPVELLEKATVRGAKLRAFREAAGLVDQGERQSTTEKVGLDLGTIFEAQSNLVTHALDKLTEMANRSPSAAQDPELSRLRDDLRETKDRLERALSEKKTPVEMLHEAMALTDEMATKFKQRLGVTQTTGTGGQDLSLLIQLEGVKQEGEDRRHQWETEMEERRQQWTREQRRWEEEFRLKRMELMDSRRSRERATDALEDLVGSVTDSIESERGTTEVGARPARRPKAFRCSECGQTVSVKSPEATEAMCEGCGTTYDLVPSEAPPSKGIDGHKAPTP